MPTLVIFVDALPFDDLHRLPRLAKWPWQARLTPGFGYSINLHAELFAGLTPDDVGFFGEWAYDPAHAPGRHYDWALPWLDAVCRPYLLNRGLQTILTRRYRPGRIMPNLPLARLGDFAIHGEKVGDRAFPKPTMFTRYPQLQRAIAPEATRKGSRDAAYVDRARTMIADGVAQLYLPLMDLDGIGHTDQTTGPRWAEHLVQLDSWIEAVSGQFLTRHPDGDVFVVSDHGMANVHGRVAFDIEHSVGKPGRQRYLYFTDSTLVRVWLFDPRLAQPVHDFLAGVSHLSLVDSQERAHYGLTNPDFGDIIGVLDEGWCFEPSTFARHIPQAMHGYHPAVASQHAVLAHRGAHPPAASATRTLDAYAAFDEALARG
jgi:hypothetical protein